MDSTKKLKKFLHKYVIPRRKYWNPEIEDSNTPPVLFPFFYTSPQGPRDDKGSYIFTYENLPIWFVTDIYPGEELLEIQVTSYLPKYRHGDYIAVKPEDVSEFVVHLYDESPSNGALGDFSERRVGEVVGDRGEWGDADDEFFYVEDKMTGKDSIYSKYDFNVVPVDDIKEDARQILTLMRVSKQGFLPPYLPENIEKTIKSQISGYPSKMSYPNILKNLKYRLEGPKHTQNIALREGPLPYGPGEENFAGGQRKKKTRVERTMARRGTRRSRGIFSRLYSPVGHLLAAGKESVGAVTNTAKGVVGEGIGGLDKIGRSVTKHANQAVREVFSRKRKGGKRRATGTRKSRKSRRNTRRR